MSAKMIKCKSCGNDIASNAKTCPNCGKKCKKPFYKKWWIWLIIIVFALACFGNSLEDDGTSSTTAVLKEKNLTQNSELSETVSDINLSTTVSITTTETTKTIPATKESRKFVTYKIAGKEYYSFEDTLDVGSVIYLKDGEKMIPYFEIIEFGENKSNNGGTIIKNAVYVKELYSIFGEEYKESLWRDLDEMKAYNAEVLEETGEPVYYVLAK